MSCAETRGRWTMTLRLAAAVGLSERPVALAGGSLQPTRLEHNPWIVVLQPYEDYGVCRYVEFTPSPDQQLELRRFNFRLRRA